MIIVLANQKGGVGKSCLSQNIAICLHRQGKKVILLDADSQKTSAMWVQDRRENESVDVDNDIHFGMVFGKCRGDIISYKENGYHVVVDCGGLDSDTMRQAILAADQVIVPFRAKNKDLSVVENMFEIIDESKLVNPELVANAVITQCPTLPNQAQRILDAKEYCKAFGLIPLNSITYNRNVYDDADESGLSVFEIEGQDDASKKAIVEIESIVEEILHGHQ